MGTSYLIDTNTILEYVSGSLPAPIKAVVDSIIGIDFNVSVINRIEVLGHESANRPLVAFMDLANTLPLTELIVDQTIALRRQKRIKLPDAVIAATALVHGFVVLSRNTKDFQNIAGLTCLNPYDLA